MPRSSAPVSGSHSLLNVFALPLMRILSLLLFAAQSANAALDLSDPLIGTFYSYGSGSGELTFNRDGTAVSTVQIGSCTNTVFTGLVSVQVRLYEGTQNLCTGSGSQAARASLAFNPPLLYSTWEYFNNVRTEQFFQVDRPGSVTGPIVGQWNGAGDDAPNIEVKSDGRVLLTEDLNTCIYPKGNIFGFGVAGEGNTYSGYEVYCNTNTLQITGSGQVTWTLSDGGQRLAARRRGFPDRSWIRVAPDPTGALERCDETYCYGWVKQAGFNGPIDVDLYAGGPFGAEGSQKVATGTASVVRGDGSYSFKIEHKLGPNRANKQMFAYAIGKDGNGNLTNKNPRLDGSPKNVQIPDPTGTLERCDETYCYGSVKQPGFNGPIDVDLYAGGPFCAEGSQKVATGTSVVRGDGSYGFKIEHKLDTGNWNKQLFAYAIGKDPDGNLNNKNPRLDGSPKNVELPKPSGALVACTSKTATTGVCTGWARQDGFSGSIDVHLYVGGSFGTKGSSKVGAGTANLPSEGNGPHGFEITYTLPEGFATTITIYAQALGRQRNGNPNGKNPVLDGSPKSIAPEDKPASGRIVRCDDTYCYGWAVTGSGGQTWVRLFADVTRDTAPVGLFADAKADQDAQTLIASVEGLSGIDGAPTGQRWFKLAHKLRDGREHKIYGYVRGLDTEGNDFSPPRNPEMQGSPLTFTAPTSSK